MSLVTLATFGSLPEASIVFSSLESGGFHPVAGFNMNTPGIAQGMAPSAYPLLVPQSEAQAARQFLIEVLKSLAEHPAQADEVMDDRLDDVSEQWSDTTMVRIRPWVRGFVFAGCALWLILILFSMRSCA